MADKHPWADLQDARYDLPLSEREKWLWNEMDPHQDCLVTDQWTEIIAAYRRSGGTCGICGKPVDLTVPSGPQQPTIDHIVALCNGGSDERCNLQLAHRQQYTRRGNDEQVSSARCSFHGYSIYSIPPWGGSNGPSAGDK